MSANKQNHRRGVMSKVQKKSGTSIPCNRLQGTLPLALLGITLSAAPPARADDECGPAAGLTEVSCDAGSGPYDHINYSTTTGLTVRLVEGAIVDEPTGNFDGLRLVGTGDDLLRIEVAEGASVTSRGDGQQAVLIAAQPGSHSRAEIDIAGDLSASSVKIDADTQVSGGALIWMQDAANGSEATIVQHASSTIQARGADAAGLVIIGENEGSATITTAGRWVGDQPARPGRCHGPGGGLHPHPG